MNTMASLSMTNETVCTTTKSFSILVFVRNQILLFYFIIRTFSEIFISSSAYLEKNLVDFGTLRRSERCHHDNQKFTELARIEKSGRLA